MDFKPLTISFKGDRAYIYVWISKKWRTIYVGQTNNTNGTLGRALNHIRGQGTLRNRFEEQIGLKLEKVEDFILLSFTLPNESKYISNESCYREAIEYKVQFNLYLKNNEVNNKYEIISNVRSNNLVGEDEIEKIAKKITNEIVEIYKEI